MGGVRQIRVSLYSPSSNPAVDPPIIRKSYSYVQGLVDHGRAVWLTFSSRPSAQLVPELQAMDDRNLLVRNGAGAINHVDMVLNACYSPSHSARARMAHAKVRLWPVIGDDRAIRVTPA